MARPPRKKATPSTIDRLEPEIQELIGQLRRRGRTINEIMAKLAELDIEISRSALGRHVRSLTDVQDELRSSREMAVALVDKYGEEGDDKLARLNIELAHSLLLRVQMAYLAAKDDDNGEGTTLTITGQELNFLSRTSKSLAEAKKVTNAEARQIRKEATEKATKEAAENATKAARAKGLSKETVDAIRHAVLGSDT